MEDNFYKKQLEEFGIESERVVRGDINKKRQEERQEINRNVMLSLSESKHGRAWLYSILDMCMTSGNVFVPGKADLTTFFLGAQWVGKQLQDQMLAVAPDKYLMMIEEEHTRASAVLNKPEE